MNALPALCLLGLLCSLTMAVDKTVPPEDIDGSADDEDFSGSGIESVVELDPNVVMVYSTSASTLVPTAEVSSATQEPEIVDEVEAENEETTKSPETTKAHNPLIDDLFAVETVNKEVTTQDATASPIQETTAEDLHDGMDTKKHHHHHHHHPHHHHTTTTSSTSPLPSEAGGLEDGGTEIHPEVDEPLNLPENITTSSPDLEVHHIPQEVTTTAEDLEEHGVIAEETTSGSTSTYVGNEEVTEEPMDVDDLPAIDNSETTTEVEGLHTTKEHHPHHHHHHHHHHPHHHGTTTSSDVQPEVTTRPSDLVDNEEANVQEGEFTTTVAEDGLVHLGHHPDSPNLETTPTATITTESENLHEIHTHEPKGRRIHVPAVGNATVVPVINEEEHNPEDAEIDDFISTVHLNDSRSSPEEIDETLDSKEEGPSGVADEDMFFEATVPAINKGRMNPSTEDDGNSDASHGIMERKEILAGIIAGGVAGLVFAAALVAFVLYRMKKKDEGSYSLEEPKQSNGGYQKPREQREFYA
ncbi:syndecan-1 [Engystomops pustulosus]|uniref:syndecan-1 n=1 Tax=Engystomops pustulosus TaxID=76066 RepID=UPI003AFA7C6E